MVFDFIVHHISSLAKLIGAYINFVSQEGMMRGEREAYKSRRESALNTNLVEFY